MNSIDVKKLGLAFGLASALLYLGCFIVMSTVGHDGTVKFFNTLLHGADVSSVLIRNVGLSEACLGIVETFILFWLVGACIAAIYNVSAEGH